MDYEKYQKWYDKKRLTRGDIQEILNKVIIKREMKQCIKTEGIT